MPLKVCTPPIVRPRSLPVAMDTTGVAPSSAYSQVGHNVLAEASPLAARAFLSRLRRLIAVVSIVVTADPPQARLFCCANASRLCKGQSSCRQCRQYLEKESTAAARLRARDRFKK